jgi:hypothetical protein
LNTEQLIGDDVARVLTQEQRQQGQQGQQVGGRSLTQTANMQQGLDQQAAFTYSSVGLKHKRATNSDSS